MNRICKVDGCENFCHKTKKICSMHNMRKYKYGSYEIPIKEKIIKCKIEGCDHDRYRSYKLCLNHLVYWNKYKTFEGYDSHRNQKKLDLIYKKITLDDVSGCFVWSGNKNKNGYGLIKYKGKRWLAHRLVYFLTHDHHPGELFVCHSCDRPICINPMHLWLGTPEDNTHDMINKGRQDYLTNKARGVKCHKHKLNKEQVILIRDLISKGNSVKEIAKQFAINFPIVERIKKNISYRDCY